MKNYFILTLCLIWACSKEEPSDVPKPMDIVDPFDPSKATSTLKDATDIPIGMAVSYEELIQNGNTYLNILKSEFDNVTYGYHMKHAAVVRNNGALDFSRTDEMFSKLNMPTFGHVLAWHTNNNGDYLRSLAVGESVSTGVNLLKNGNFEDGSGTGFTDWANVVGGTAQGSFEEETKDVLAGSKRALKAVITKTGANAWDMQTIGPDMAVDNAKQYKISLLAKSLSGNGRFKLIIQKNNYAENQINISQQGWNKYEWTFSTSETPTTFKIHFNGEGTYLIDNITIEPVSTTLNTDRAAVAKKVDAALKTWVHGILKKYPTVKAWDAINEVFTDGASTLRTGSSTGDTYYWHQYLGRSYIAKTFQYAKEACAECEFFINDYNLEYNSIKLDSTIALAKELKAAGCAVAGIGTQMHMNINTSQGDIDNMFKKLAATGLKVRVSELDIKINPSNAATISFDKNLSDIQAEKYRQVVKSYITHVPKAQQHGITIWGMSDKDSWIVLYQKQADFPLMWDEKFNKKPAYMGLWRGLRGL